MKHWQTDLLIIGIAALLICGCLTNDNQDARTNRHADEIESIDFSIINDGSHWVDPAWLR